MRFKYFIISVCLVVLAAGLVGCSNDDSKSELSKTAGSGAGMVVSKASNEVDNIFRVSLGETFTCPNRYQICFDSYEFMDDLKVGNVTLKEKKDGVSYFVVKGKIKNLGSDESMVGWGFPRGIDTSFTFNDQYKVEGEPTAVSNLGFEPSVKPLITTGFWSIAEVSSDFKDQFRNCEMTLNVNREQEYKDGSLDWTGEEEVVSSYVLSI